MIIRVLLAAVIASGIVSCSTQRGAKQGSTKNRTTYLDPATEKKSELFYNFLKGEMALNEERTDDAVIHLSEAGTLSSGSDEVLRSQLVALKIEQGDLDGALIENEKVLSGKALASDYILQGAILDTLGRFEEAKKAYETSLKLEPENLVTRLYLAQCLYALKQIPAAEKEIASVIKQEPKLSLAHFYAGTLARERGDLKIAAKHILKARILEPENKKIQLTYLALLLQDRRVKEARNILDELNEKWGQSTLSLVIKATSSLLDQGDKEKAKEFLQTFLGEDAIEAQELRRHVGIVQVEQRNFESAIQTLSIVLSKDPSDAKARYFLGTAYAALGLKKRSVVELRKIPDSDQMYIEAQTFASFLLRQLGELKEAEVSVRQALEKIDGTDQNLELFLVDILRAAGNYDDAAEVMESILERDRKDPKTLFLYGTILDEEGDRDEAMKVMEELIVIDPHHAQALNFIAYTLADHGTNLDQALNLSQQALSEFPDDGFFLDTLGWVYFKKGEFQKAIDILARAVNLTGDDMVILEHYAEALRSNGQVGKALSVYISVAQRDSESLDRKDLSIQKRSRTKISEILSESPDLKKIAEASGYISGN